ncbi:hypothetical protein [Mongoliimonas terrestris]|uniref:hypothetical protein n=1 Tax=Mongoliimonas terrestris TaxID=1709001 RepID=UPI0009497F4C|nr:hypothetical protein [Mongoliimonas terrestris]
MNAAHRHLTRIRLELARTKGFPEGSAAHGYAFVAPLDADGKLDAVAWKSVRDRCRVHRFWGADDEDIGHLVRRPGGSWAFHYDVDGDEDDEAGYRLGDHRFAIGEYVSVRDEDGDLHTFRVVSTEAVMI